MTAPTRRTQAEINESFLSVDHLKAGLGGRTARGGAIVLSAQVVRIFVQLVTTFILARLLAPADFGVVAMGYTVMTLLGLITEIGLSTVTVQTKNLNQDTASALLFLNVGLTFVAVALAFAISPLLVMVFRDERVPAVVVGLVATTPITALGSQHNALLMRNMRWMPIQVISLGALVAGSLAAVVAATVFNLGYWALVVQAMATAIIGLVAVWAYCPWRPSLVRNWAGIGTALRTSLNLNGTMALNFLHRQFDQVLVGWRWGSTELGYYSRAYALLMMPLNLVTGPLTSAIVPALSRLQDEPDKWRRAYLDSLIGVTALGGCMAAMLYGAAEPIVRIVLGPGWDRSEEVFSYLALAMLAATPMSTVVWIYVSLGRTFRMFQWGLIGTTGYVASFLIGLPWGAPGVALAYGCAQLIAFLPCLWMATRQSPATLVDVLKACGPIMAVTVVIGGLLRLITDHVGLVFDILVTGVAFGLYAAAIATLIWRWAPHRRVRDRVAPALQKALARVGFHTTWLTRPN